MSADAACEVMASGLGEFVQRFSLHWCGAPGGALERLHDSVPGLSRSILGCSLLVEHGDVIDCLTLGVDPGRCHGHDVAVSRDRLRASAHDPSSSFQRQR